MSAVIENAKDSFCGVFIGTAHELDEIFEPVEVENEKLRKLILKIWKCADINVCGHFCEDCLIEDDKEVYICPLKFEMRELGIEF